MVLVTYIYPHQNSLKFGDFVFFHKICALDFLCFTTKLDNQS